MMHQSEPRNDKADAPVILVSVREGLDYRPEVLHWAGVVREAGWDSVLELVDLCTDENVFGASLREKKPQGILLIYATEWREMLARAGAIAHEATGLPIHVVGAASGRPCALPVPENPGFMTLGSPQESALAAALGWAPPKAGSYSPALGLYGRDIARRPPSCSLFAELGTLGMLGSRESVEALSPVAALARLANPGKEAGVAQPHLLRRALDEVERPRRLEWWDADFASDHLKLLAPFQDLSLSHAVRLQPSSVTERHLLTLKTASVDRVVMTVDRVKDLRPMAGTHASAEDLQQPAARIRAASLELGLLLVVGLPGETAEHAAERLEAVRRLAPDHLRVVPFEPTGGHPVFDQLFHAGCLPSGEVRWKREVHRPLKQDSMTHEEYIRVWAAAHELQAELAVKGWSSGVTT